MTEISPDYLADSALKGDTNYRRENATQQFLNYHSQYQGPYLWRVHLVLPLMLAFGTITACLQHYRPILRVDAAVQLF